METGTNYGLIQAISNACVTVISKDLGSSSDVLVNIGKEFVVKNTPEEFAVAIGRIFHDKHFFSESVEKAVKWRNSYTGRE